MKTLKIFYLRDYGWIKVSVGTFGALADCGLLKWQEARGCGQMVFNENSKINYKTKAESIIKLSRCPVIAHSVVVRVN